MKKFAFAALAFAAGALLCATPLQAKKKNKENTQQMEATHKEVIKEVYAFGVAASFNDSIVYFTEIMPLDSATISRKTSELSNRDLYSYQLKNYIEEKKGKKNYTCMIFFAKNKAKLHKEISKIRSKYLKGEHVSLQDLSMDDFVFTKPETY